MVESASQLTVAVPSTTAITASPSTMITSRPNRSGMCAGCTGEPRISRQAWIGAAYSKASARPQSTYRQGLGTASEMSHRTTATENIRMNHPESRRATSTCRYART